MQTLSRSQGVLLLTGILACLVFWASFQAPGVEGPRSLSPRNDLRHADFWTVVASVKKQHSNDILINALLQVKAKLDMCAIPYAVTYGTLLGIMRTGWPLAGDNDVDLMLMEDRVNRTDVLKCLGQPHSVDLCPDAAIPSVCRHQFRHRYYMPYIQNVTGTPVLVDIYWLTQIESSTCFCWGDLYAMPNSVVLPFRPLSEKVNTWLDPRLRSMNGPNLPLEFITQRYGPHWRTPQTDWLQDSDHGNGDFVDFLMQPIYGDKIFECCQVHNQHPWSHYCALWGGIILLITLRLVTMLRLPCTAWGLNSDDAIDYKQTLIKL